MLRQRSWIDEANEKVAITDVLTYIGVYVPSTILGGGNKKIHCPFGFYHSDGGTAKAMRVYLKTNSVYCFSCTKRYNSVSLAAANWGCSWIAAALRLLEDSGYKPKTLEQRWQEALTIEIDPPDTLALAEALKTYCASQCNNWETRQLDEDVSHKLSRCLALLDFVRTDEDADRWLTTTKSAMANQLSMKV